MSANSILPAAKDKVLDEVTFETVDDKIAEAEFFLRKMYEVGFAPWEFKWYLSAFLAAARTTTLTLQRFYHIPNFKHWYTAHQKCLETNDLAKFFLSTRNEHIHGGSYPVSSAEIRGNQTKFFFTKKDLITEDVVSVSREYFLLLLKIVYDCYTHFGTHIDPQQYFTKKHFKSLGKTIDHAEVEIWDFVRTSLKQEGYSIDDRWQELRSMVGKCEINHLFYSYLGQITPQPKVPAHYYDFAYTPEDKGWNHIPAGFNSLKAYRKVYGLKDPDEEDLWVL